MSFAEKLKLTFAQHFRRYQATVFAEQCQRDDIHHRDGQVVLTTKGETFNNEHFQKVLIARQQWLDSGRELR